MKIQNTSGALNPDCLAARPASKAWECMFAQNSYAVTKVPTFVDNSALDMWQMWCIYGAAPISGFPSPNSSINGNCSAPIVVHKDPCCGFPQQSLPLTPYAICCIGRERRRLETVRDEPGELHRHSDGDDEHVYG